MTNFDLKTLGLADGDYEITVVAKASGYKDSPPSNAVSYVVGNEQPETPTQGLAYELSADGTYYTCKGIGTATDTDIIIASQIDGIPVTHISIGAFYQNTSITSVVIPSSITFIGDSAFYGCSSLETIYCEAEIKPDGWDNEWNFGCDAQVIWGYKGEETYTIPAGTYLFNETLTMPTTNSITYFTGFTFTSNNTTYTEIGVGTGKYQDYLGDDTTITNGLICKPQSYNGYTAFYQNNTWYNENDKTIVVNVTQIVSAEFNQWFTANTFLEKVYTIPQGLYILDDEIDLASLMPKGSNGIGCYIDFNSNNAKYTRLGIQYNSTDNRYELCFNYGLSSPTIACYSSSGGLYWNNNAYKTLILQTDQYVDSYIYKLLTEHARKDELYGLWIFNSYLAYQSLDTINMNFQSNGQSYSSIRAEYNGDGLYLYFDNTLVCTTDQDLESGSWVKNDYRYIYVTSQLSEVTNGSTLLAWLNNTSKQINNPLNGNWYLRSEFEYADANGTYAVNYQSNGIEYTQITFSSIIDDTTPTRYRQTLRYGYTTIINNGVWVVGSTYQKIYITDLISAVENGFSLLSTLQQGITGYNADLVRNLLRTNGDFQNSTTTLSSLVLFFDSASENKVKISDTVYTKYRNVLRVQLDASGTASTIIPYQINNIVDYLENQGTGNPSETLALTSDIIIDTGSYSSDCVTADTLVTMADGTSKAIGDIDVGEYILSYDWETMKLVPNKVIYSSKNDTSKSWTAHRYFKRTFSDGTVIKNAFAHRFYNLEDKMFKHLDFWQEGEHGYKFDGSFPHLVKVEKVYETCKYARITGELGTNFFANGLLTGDSECPQNIDLSQIVNKE